MWAGIKTFAWKVLVHFWNPLALGGGYVAGKLDLLSWLPGALSSFSGMLG